jgi:hypothetical protein
MSVSGHTSQLSGVLFARHAGNAGFAKLGTLSWLSRTYPSSETLWRHPSGILLYIVVQDTDEYLSRAHVVQAILFAHMQPKHFKRLVGITFRSMVLPDNTAVIAVDANEDLLDKVDTLRHASLLPLGRIPWRQLDLQLMPVPESYSQKHWGLFESVAD